MTSWCEVNGHAWVRIGVSNIIGSSEISWGPWHCERCGTYKQEENTASG